MKTALIFELRLFIESASELQLLKLVEVLSRERKEIARKAEKSISTTAFIKPMVSQHTCVQIKNPPLRFCQIQIVENKKNY